METTPYSSALNNTEPVSSVARTASEFAILSLQNLRQNLADDFLGFSLADAVITKLNHVSSLTIRRHKSFSRGDL